MNPKATSGYDCVKKELGLVGCWSTEGKCPECNEQVIIYSFGLVCLCFKWTALKTTKIVVIIKFALTMTVLSNF